MIFFDNKDERNEHVALKLGIPLISEVKKSYDTIILPLGAIDKSLCLGDFNIKDIYEKYPFKRLIVGSVNNELMDYAKNRFVLSSYYDEEYVRENSSLTAIGLLGLMITKMKMTPYNKKVLVLGYGASAREICEVMKKYTNKIDVYNRHKYEMPYNYVLDPIDDYDIIINTIPVKTKEFINGAKFDIASKNVLPNSIFEPKIPGRLFPSEAGMILTKSIRRAINGNN